MFRVVVPRKSMEYGVYGDLIMRYPKPYSVYLRGTIGVRVAGFHKRTWVAPTPITTVDG